MIFEEALALLRQGKKIRHPSFDEDEFLMGCYRSIDGFEWDEDKFRFKHKEKLSDEEWNRAKSLGMSIVRMKGEFIHKNNGPHFKFPLSAPCGYHELHLYPQINLFLLMQDNWELYGEE
jgi:hypothetical protein